MGGFEIRDYPGMRHEGVPTGWDATLRARIARQKQARRREKHDGLRMTD